VDLRDPAGRSLSRADRVRGDRPRAAGLAAALAFAVLTAGAAPSRAICVTDEGARNTLYFYTAEAEAVLTDRLVRVYNYE